MKALQGSWTITALETEGTPMNPATLGGSRIIVNGDRFTTVGMGETFNGTYTVDEKTSPKTIDLNFADGPHKGLASLGIYKQRGNSWTICLGFAGMTRPSAFKTAPGSGHALETLTRDEGGAPTTAADRPRVAVSIPPLAHPDEIARLGGEWSAVSIITGGKPLPEQYLPMVKRVAKGNEITVSAASQVQLHVLFDADPTTRPCSLDYTTIDGPGAGNRMLGIYERKGDMLRTLFVPAGKPRPTTFETTAGDGSTLSVWKKR